MQFTKNHIYFLLFLFLFSCSKPPQKTSTVNVPDSQSADSKNEVVNEEPKIIELKDGGLTPTDLKIILENTVAVDSGSKNDIAENLIRKVLFVKEARNLGMDSNPDFREQLKSNLQIVMDQELLDSKEVKKLGDEAYERYRKEINASHIFMPVSNDATPAEEDKIYRQLLTIRKTAIENANFTDLAKTYSKDTKTALNGGDLGWFSVFNLIYPLEIAVYATPKDSVSMPVRSKSGFHLFKVNDIRPNSGTVKVQHIWKLTTPDMSQEQLKGIYNLLDSVRSRILVGAKFEDMARQYSDDINSKNDGGILPSFGIGTRTEAAFENVAFSLKSGEISKPFQSSSGYHIIRLIEKNPPLSKQKFLEENDKKLITDSRAEYLNQKRIEDFIQKNQVKIDSATLTRAINFSNQRILTATWQKPTTILLNDNLFSINEKNYKVSDYYDYVTDRQDIEAFTTRDVRKIFTNLFNKYFEKSIRNYQEDKLLNSNPELKRYAQSLEEDMLYSAFTDRYIIEKSALDSLGQRKFFEANRSQFLPRETGNLTIFSFADQATYDKFKEIVNAEKPFRLNRGITPLYFDENQYALNDAAVEKLKGLIRILNLNPDYIVEIGGHEDTKESNDVSALRLREVVKYLISNGIALRRIQEVNYKSSIIHDRFDWSKNQVVTFQFLSNAETSLIRTFNTKNEDAVRYNVMKIGRTEFENKMKTNWENKTDRINIDGRIEEYTLTIKKNTGTYKDYQPEVMRKYQAYLIADYEKKLSEKFNLKYNKNNIYNLIDEIKEKN